MLGVPLLRDGEPAVSLSNAGRLRPFTDRHIALVRIFRRSSGDCHRERAVVETSWQNSTARTRIRCWSSRRRPPKCSRSSAVLLAILQPVFATMLEKAVRICDAKFGNIFRWDGEALHLVATHNTPPAFARHASVHQFVLVPELAQVACQRPKMAVHVADIAATRATLNNAIPQSLPPSNSEGYGRYSLYQC